MSVRAVLHRVSHAEKRTRPTQLDELKLLQTQVAQEDATLLDREERGTGEREVEIGGHGLEVEGVPHERSGGLVHLGDRGGRAQQTARGRKHGARQERLATSLVVSAYVVSAPVRRLRRRASPRPVRLERALCAPGAVRQPALRDGPRAARVPADARERLPRLARRLELRREGDEPRHERLHRRAGPCSFPPGYALTSRRWPQRARFRRRRV